jgi:acetyltransferase-like isoleucine patch superfamily enzyme
MVRQLIKTYGYKLIKFIIPEIKILSRNLNWDYIDSSCSKNTIGTTVKIATPAHINHTFIGDYSYISVNAWISHTDIGRFCSIGPNFLCGWGIHPTNGISTSPMFYSTMKQNGITLSSENKIEERKTITIGNDVFIGANVTVLDGITIGDGAVIGAGSIVSKDIPPYAIAVGSPIRIIRYRFEKDQIDRLLKVKWWYFDKDKLEDVEKMFFHVDEFIQKYERQ